jgi:tol-pal system protein YbgF
MSAPQGGAAPGGGLPAPPPINPSATGAMQAALPPANTPKDEFALGTGYIQQKDYAQATETFRDFLKKYPSDRLTPEAQYWLGESLFQSQQYRDAAEAFLAVSTKYETTARAPDALLRLGQSLAALGEKEAACASLGEACPLLGRPLARTKRTRCSPVLKICPGSSLPSPAVRIQPRSLFSRRAGRSGVNAHRRFSPSPSTMGCGRKRPTRPPRSGVWRARSA